MQDDRAPRALRGSCLCGAVRFEVDGPIDGVGQCHCSQCRKVSGTASNANFIVGGRRFRWTAGADHSYRYARASGWSTTRCDTCGSPLPQSIDGKRWWVPAGLMDDDLATSVRVHIFCASKADWDTIDGDAAQFPAGFEAPR